MRAIANARRGRENSNFFRPSRTRVPDELMYGGGHILGVLGYGMHRVEGN